MAQVTGGRITYSRTVSPAQYESKRAEVEFNFVLADEEELGGVVADLLEQAREEVHEAVGIRSRSR